MADYLIAFNDHWVPDHTVEELRAQARAVRPVVAEMQAAGVLKFTGGVNNEAPVFTADVANGEPVFTDGPFDDRTELLGGFAVVDVEDDAAARYWAGKIAVACGWPQEVRRFRVPMQLSQNAQQVGAANVREPE